MEINKKYLTKRNLDIYSELEFARYLNKIGQSPYFPFKDVGIDIIGIDRGLNPFFYQLKARNFNIRKGVWGFKIDRKKLQIFPKTKNSFWIFCVLKIAQDGFIFFKIPTMTLEKIYAERIKSCSEREGYFLDIRQNKSGTWEFVSPSRLNDLFNINEFLIK